MIITLIYTLPTKICSGCGWLRESWWEMLQGEHAGSSRSVRAHRNSQCYRCAEIRRDGELELEDQNDRSGDNQAATEDGLPGERLAEKERGKHKNHHQAGFIDRRDQRGVALL